MSVLKPWTAVKTNKTDGSYEVSVLNRKYTFDKNGPLFSSIISGGEELLASPMRIVAENKGEACVLCKPETFMMKADDEDGERFITSIQSEFAVFNISHNIEFDGCDEIYLSVMPTGRSVAACFGLEEYDKGGFDVDKLWLEIPLSKDIFKYYSIYPSISTNIYNNPEEADIEFSKNAEFKSSSIIPESGLHMPFLGQIYLNGDDKGMGFFFESSENFTNNEPDRVFEVLRCDDCILLRIRFFDKTPLYWMEKGVNNENSRNLLPIKFHFGMQVTPVKNMTAYPYEEKNFHVDCFKKTPGYYDEYFSNPVVEGDSETGFDRIKRLGVDTLYIHEKWNDVQNSIELTYETSERLKYIVSECHKRGIKVIPYFGYELSTLSKYYNEHGGKFLMKKESNDKYINSMISWYRFPYQRDIKVCYGSEYADIFADGIIELQKQYGFDGFYFDATVNPNRCANYEHGCGYVDRNGVIRTTVNHFAVRRMMKKIYRYASENNLIINAHIGFHSLATVGYYTSSWIGEDIQGILMRGEISRVPEGHMRAKYTARDIGVPTYTLCYSSEKWSFSKAAGIAMLYGSLPKPVDIGEPLEYMSRIWKITDEFPMDKAEWLPYYNGNSFVNSDDDNVKISIYKAGNKILAVCTALTGGFDKNVEINSAYYTICDAESREKLSSNGKCTLHFTGFETKLLLMEQ